MRFEKPIVCLAFSHRDGWMNHYIHQLEDAGLMFAVRRINPFSWRARLEWVREISGKVSPDRPLVFTDAWDVAFVGLGKELEAYCAEVETAVFGAERGCWPDPDLAPRYDTIIPEGLKYRFLNAGVFAARAGWLASFLGGFDLSTVRDDQEWWTHRLLESPEKIHLDLPGRLVHNCFKDPEGEITARKDGRIVGATRGNLPLFVHMNGKAGTPAAVMLALAKGGE